MSCREYQSPVQAVSGLERNVSLTALLDHVKTCNTNWTWYTRLTYLTRRMLCLYQMTSCVY